MRWLSVLNLDGLGLPFNLRGDLLGQLAGSACGVSLLSWSGKWERGGFGLPCPETMGPPPSTLVALQSSQYFSPFFLKPVPQTFFRFLGKPKHPPGLPLLYSLLLPLLHSLHHSLFSLAIPGKSRYSPSQLLKPTHLSNKICSSSFSLKSLTCCFPRFTMCLSLR